MIVTLLSVLEILKISFDFLLCLCFIGFMFIIIQKKNLHYFYNEPFLPDNQEYRKVIKHFYTVQFVLISTSFGLISIFFGLHTDIIVAYDKNDDYKTHKPLLREEYFWFFPSNIISFPIEQINLTNENIPPTQVDFSTYHQDKIPFTLTISDFTPSTNPAPDSVIFKPFANKLGKITEFECGEKENFDIRAKIPLFFFSELTKIDTSQHYLSFMQFSGLPNKKLESFYHEPWQLAKDLSMCSDATGKIKFLSRYKNTLDTIKNSTGKKTISNFIEIIDGIKESINSAKNIYTQKGMNSKDIYFTLNIISDFAHEDALSGVSFDSLEYKIRTLSQMNEISRCNLLILPNISKVSKSESVKKTIEIFQKYFKNGKPVYFGTELKYLAANYADEKSLSSIINIPSEEIPKLKFYYPYRFYQNQNTYSTKLLINNPLEGENKKYALLFRDKNGNRGDNPEFFCHTFINDSEELMIKVGASTSVNLVAKIDTLSIRYIPNDVDKNRDMSLEIDHNDRKFIFNIDFFPTLPKTSSLYFLMLYCLFFTSFFLIIFYYLSEISLRQKSLGLYYRGFTYYFKWLAAFLNLMILLILWCSEDYKFNLFITVLVITIVLSSRYKFNKLWELNKPFHKQH